MASWSMHKSGAILLPESRWVIKTAAAAHSLLDYAVSVGSTKFRTAGEFVVVREPDPSASCHASTWMGCMSNAFVTTSTSAPDFVCRGDALLNYASKSICHRFAGHFGWKGLGRSGGCAAESRPFGEGSTEVDQLKVQQNPRRVWQSGQYDKGISGDHCEGLRHAHRSYRFGNARVCALPLQSVEKWRQGHSLGYSSEQGSRHISGPGKEGEWKPRTPPWIGTNGLAMDRSPKEAMMLATEEDDEDVLEFDDESLGPSVGIYWDLDNKPPEYIDPRTAASRLRTSVASLGNVVEYVAFANRHAFEYVPAWVREERQMDKRRDHEERMGNVPPADQPYVCGLCGRKCRTNADLKKHFKQLHEREHKKRMGVIDSKKGKKRKKKITELSLKNSRYTEAARGIILPKRGYGLMPDLKRSGVGVRLVKEGPEAADVEMRRTVMKALKRRIDCVCLVSDDRGFEDLVREARSRLVKTVVIGNCPGLRHAADLSLSWLDVQAGQARLRRDRGLEEGREKGENMASHTVRNPPHRGQLAGYGSDDETQQRRFVASGHRGSAAGWQTERDASAMVLDENKDEESDRYCYSSGEEEDEHDNEGAYRSDWDAGSLRWNHPN